MTITTTLNPKCPLAGANLAVVSQLVARSSANQDYPVPVPSKACRLIRAEAITTTVVATADMTIDLELNAAGGSAIGTITVATSGSAIGTIDTLEWADMTQANAKSLSLDDSARDYINLEVNSHATGAGGAMVHLFFEREANQ